MDSYIAAGLLMRAIVDDACSLITLSEDQAQTFVGLRAKAMPIGADGPLPGVIERANRGGFVFRPDGMGLVKCGWKKLISVMRVVS